MLPAFVTPRGTPRKGKLMGKGKFAGAVLSLTLVGAAIGNGCTGNKAGICDFGGDSQSFGI